MVIGYVTSLYARVADTFIRDEVQELRRRGHLVHTFSIRGPVRDEAVDEAVRREQEATDYILAHGILRLIASFAVELLRYPKATLGAAKLAWRTRSPGLRALVWQLAYLVEAAYLARCIRARGIEHLHDHIGTNSATVAMLAARMAGVPFSMTIHGPVEFDAPERFALAAKIERAAFTVCVSSFGRSQCMRWAAASSWTRIHVVRCGLDATFLDAPSAPIPDRPRFLSVGRLSEQKGQSLLLDAVALLARGGIRSEVALIGDGPLRPELEARVRALGIGASVELLGWKDAAAVRAELLRARALVLPSLAEGLPIVLMEALALRRPVVTTWVAGIPELVRHREHGWLVPPGSVEALADAMREVALASGEELMRMGEAGARRVRERHALRAQGEQLERLFVATREARRRP